MQRAAFMRVMAVNGVDPTSEYAQSLRAMNEKVIASTEQSERLVQRRPQLGVRALDPEHGGAARDGAAQFQRHAFADTQLPREPIDGGHCVAPVRAPQ